MQDGPIPLLHLRTNETFFDKGNEGDQSDMGSDESRILSILPDEGLKLAIVHDQDGVLEVDVPSDIMAGLLSKLKEVAPKCSATRHA